MPTVIEFTDWPGFTATEILNTTSDQVPIVRAGDQDYKASLEILRGSRVFCALDYGAVGDGVTDDRAAIQKMIDAAAIDQVEAIFYFPRGNYMVSSDGAGRGIDLKDKFHIVGDGSGTQNQEEGSSIIFTSSTAGDALFELTNNQAINYAGSSLRHIAFKADNGTTISNLDCFLMDAADGSHGWEQPHWENVAFVDFSGGVINAIHNNPSGNNQGFGSSGLIMTCKMITCGAFLKVDGPRSDSNNMGTNLTFINTLVTGWNDQSPHNYFFNFAQMREVNMYNTVFQGTNRSTAANAIFFIGGDRWLKIDGFHYEMVGGTHPTMFAEFDTEWNVTAARSFVAQNAHVFASSMKLGVCDQFYAYLENCRGDNENLTTDMIDETNANVGEWSIEFNGGWKIEVADRHVGHFKVRGSTELLEGMTAHLDNNTSAADYEAWRDGWFLGNVVSGYDDDHPFGSKYAYAYLNTQGSNHLIGMVDDDDEGRVWAIRMTGFPLLETQWTLPSTFGGTAGQGDGAQLHWAMRYKFLYNGTSIRALMINYRGTVGKAFSVNHDHTPPPTTWQTGYSTAFMDDDVTPFCDTVGSGSPSETIELRVAWFKAGLGYSVPTVAGTGAHIGINDNRTPPLKWDNDGIPTWGDYKRGDEIFNTSATASGDVVGWRCVSSGAKAPDWAISTAYVVDDWVLNDTNEIYKCVVGGTSAGSGGPTSTATGIVDNTVTWDHHSVESSWLPWGLMGTAT